MKNKTHLLLLASITFSILCSQAHANKEKPYNKIEIVMSDSEASALHQPTRTDIPFADYKVYQDDILLNDDKIKLNTRGQGSLRKFYRKNMEINKIENNSKLEVGSIKGKEIILSAAPSDQLLTKNMIIYRLYKAVGIKALDTDYAEVKINNQSQGLYMVSSSPSEQMLKKENADIIFRRRYADFIEIKKIKKNLSEVNVNQYKDTMNSIYESVSKKNNTNIVSQLSKNFNLDNYLKWLAINYLVHHGDYFDEVFFYGTQSNQSPYFDIFPWDNDDAFSDKMHLEKIPLTSNFRKSARSQRQMLYGFESKIDQAISENPYLLQKYFSVLESVLISLNEDKLDQIFKMVTDKVTPYLNEKDILNSGILDIEKKAYTREGILEQLGERKQFIKNNIQSAQHELNLIKSEPFSERARRLKGKKIGLFIQKVLKKVIDSKK